MAASIRIHAVCRRWFRASRKPIYTRFSSRVLSEASEVGNSERISSNRETHFGFEYVPEDEKERRVHEVFHNVAEKYDLMNDAMSMGIHRLWKDKFMQRLAPNSGTRLIDVAGGTGDIAFRFLKYVHTSDSQHVFNGVDGQTFEMFNEVSGSSASSSKDLASSSSEEEESDSFDDEVNFSTQSCILKSHVTVCDINQAMLNIGKRKASQLGYQTGVSWLKGNAECLPIADSSFDAYTVAFGIRNVTHIEKVLQEAYRVLKSGGRFMCLEFSKVDNSILQSLYDLYSFQVIPVMGQVIASDWKSYQYLVESIRQFPDQDGFAGMIQSAGFRMVTYENLMFGVAAIHSGFKLT